ncbi:MAG: restriction endonuclease [Phycisphaerae bacterium]|nr:restriction endonuclease [Phycisphaerae bacterium]
MAKDDAQRDISYTLNHNADTLEAISCHIDSEVLNLYDVYSYRHAAAILKTSYPNEMSEIEQALLNFRITKTDIGMPGGSESVIPKKFSEQLRPEGWCETQIQGDLIVRISEHSEEILPSGGLKKHKLPDKEPITLKNYIDGHKIDYVKGQVAFDLEWNSKDQTFDRDLYAFRMFHECGVISVAVLVTRSEKLNPVFDVTELLKKDGTVDYKSDGNPKMCKQKYGASTTWMGKLLPRLNAGRHGGCPVLVFGIRPDVIKEIGK